MKQYIKSVLYTVQEKRIVRYLEVENGNPIKHVKLQNGKILQKGEVSKQQMLFFQSEKSYFNNWTVVTQKEFENAWEGRNEWTA